MISHHVTRRINQERNILLTIKTRTSDLNELVEVIESFCGSQAAYWDSGGNISKNKVP